MSEDAKPWRVSNDYSSSQFKNNPWVKMWVKMWIYHIQNKCIIISKGFMPVISDAFHWGTRDSKSSQISSILLPFFFSHYFYKPQQFRPTVSWWSFMGVWVIAILPNSPGLFSVFWLILIIMYSECFPLVLWFLSLPVR